MTKSTLIISIFLLAFCAAVGIAAEANNESKARQLIDPSASGNLQLIIGAGASPKYLQEWVSTPSNKPARVERIKEIKPDQTAYVGFFVTGYSIDGNKNVNCTVDVMVYDPRGKVLFSMPKYARVRGSYKEKSFLALDPGLDFTLEASDPEGNYRIEGTISDNVSGKTAKASYDLKLTKK